MSNLAKLVSDLKFELDSRSEGYILRFADIIEQVAIQHDPACISMLLPLFDDDAEYEPMYAILHTIENFDHLTFINVIIENLESLFTTSPIWLVDIHVRIFNSSSALKVYADCIRTIPLEKKVIVQKVLERVSHEYTHLFDICNSLRAIIGTE